MSDDEKAKSWWQTLPGMLAGVAAIISASAALLVAINQGGWFSRSGADLTRRDGAHVAVPQGSGAADSGATAAAQGTLVPGRTSIALPELREYRLGDLVFTLLSASLTPRTTEAGTLSVRIRLLNNQNYTANFWNEQFRLFVDNVPESPSGSLNELVEGGAAKDAEVTFVVPRTASTLMLRIQDRTEKTDIRLGTGRS